MKDLRNRLSKTRIAFARLKRTCNSKSIAKRTKLRLFETLNQGFYATGHEKY